MATNFDDLLSPKQLAYSQKQIVSHSYYNDDIITDNNRVAGNSRIAGDASAETQLASIRALLNASEGLPTQDKAMILAIVRQESGFNPDAAAGTTSASGLGQFVNGTGKQYDLSEENRWDLNAQASAVVDYYIDCKNQTAILGQDTSHIYALWHDGINSGGKGDGHKLSQDHVMPYVEPFERAISNVGTYLREPENQPKIVSSPDFASIVAKLQASGLNTPPQAKEINQEELMQNLQKAIGQLNNVADNQKLNAPAAFDAQQPQISNGI